jgi:sulfhydrogenase subunit alpha
MGASASVVVRHLTRVEGHGNIVVDVEGGVVRRCDLEIVESPRFFEVLLKDRPYDEAPRIACRICGICSVAHATASVQAVEAALGVRPGPKLRLLRRLNMAGEWLQSHVLHLGFLVAPDAFGAPSVVPLAESHPEVVKRSWSSSPPCRGRWWSAPPSTWPRSTTTAPTR